MKEYHKIQTLFKRDMEAPGRPLIEGEWTTPEFEYLQDNQWVLTEKIDGTNIRVHYDGDEVLFGGRTDKANIPPHLLSALNEMFPIDVLKYVFPDLEEGGSVCLYGEGYGHKIQKGHHYLGDDTSFILFDVMINDWWLKRNDCEDIATRLGIKIVPIVSVGTLWDAISLVKKGYKSFIAQDNSYDAEGLVAKPLCELKSRSGQRIVTKIKHRDFPSS